MGRGGGERERAESRAGVGGSPVGAGLGRACPSRESWAGRGGPGVIPELPSGAPLPSAARRGGAAGGLGSARPPESSAVPEVRNLPVGGSGLHHTRRTAGPVLPRLGNHPTGPAAGDTGEGGWNRGAAARVPRTLLFGKVAPRRAAWPRGASELRVTIFFFSPSGLVCARSSYSPPFPGLVHSLPMSGRPPSARRSSFPRHLLAWKRPQSSFSLSTSVTF